MSISAIGSAPAAAPASASDVSAPRADDTHADDFAQLFASVMNAAAKPAAAAKKAEGTSELDQPDTANDSDSGSAGTTKADDTNDPAAAAATTSSSNSIVRSLAALDPQLQVKLQRVITRMRQETGHDVSVAETYRSQTRQDKLFAQGRTAPGEVVTWTQRSKHTEGRAVDVMVDGGEAGGDAYRALQRIAGQEGLGTLGARDPGHLELRGRGPRLTNDQTPQMPAEPADATGPGSVSVARLAQVARVAQVKPTMVARPAHAAVAPVAPTAPLTPASPYGVTLAARDPHVPAPAQPVAGAAGVEAVARAERVMAVRDSAPARALSHITMSVDAGNGATDRVQVSMRGAALNATIDTADARAAQAMNARGDELARALDKQGVELETLRVRSADAAAGVTAASHARESRGGSDAYSQSRFDRGDAWQQQQDQQERNRSRQDRDDRRQQREQRGGRK